MCGHLATNLWSVHLVVRIQDFHSCHTDSNSVPTTNSNFKTMAILIITLICFAFGFVFHATIDTFKQDNLLMKITGIIVSVIMLGFAAVFAIGHKEEVQIQTMNDYFEGKVEVIEQVDTVRTFKFN